MSNPEEIKKQSQEQVGAKAKSNSQRIESSKKQQKVQESPKKEKNLSKQKKKTKETKSSPRILEEKSVNLIPVMSREEIKEEEKKKKINKGSLISLLFLFSISILIVGFSIISQIQLNYQKEKLFEYEEELSSYNQVIIDNNEVLQRIALYQDVQRDRYSTTKVVDHIQGILDRSGASSFSSFGFSGRTGIDFRGDARDLEELAKLWYLLTNDPKLERVTLRTLSKGSSGVSFTFEANIILEEFILLTED